MALPRPNRQLAHLTCALGLMMAAQAHAQPQPAADARLLAASRAAEPEVIRTLEALVAIESGSAQVDGLNRVADLAAQRLRALGASVERLASTTAPGGPIVRARLEGRGTRQLLLIGHMDTVYPPGILATQPFRRDGNQLFGPGVADDKGGIAVILHALGVLREAGWSDYRRITVLLNADEETGSTGSGELIATEAAQHDVVLSFEPSPAKAVIKAEALLLAASGTATAFLEVQGRASHAGAAPQLGRNALIELSHQLLQTREVAQGIPGTQLNWTVAKAGEVRNQIPASASAIGDVRLTVADGQQKLQAALNEKVANRLVPDTQTTVRLETGRPPYVATERGRALAKHAQSIYAELDGRYLALVPTTGGGTDAGFASRSGRAVVMESFGLAGHGYHARDEFIEIDSIAPRLYLVTRLMMDIGAGKVPGLDLPR